MFRNLMFFAIVLGTFGFAVGFPVAEPVAQAPAAGSPGPLDFVTDVLEIVAIAEALNGTKGTTGSTQAIP